MVNVNRYLKNIILQDINSKIVLLSGPRQAGKTTLSKCLFKSYDYLNFDSTKDRAQMQAGAWDRSCDLVIFDELHKMEEWKRWLKGTYDTEGLSPKIMVTGSARMDVFRKVGDSLAGRFFSYRLHPFDLKEIANQSDTPPEEAFARLWDCSGFPEPFLKGNERFYKRWRRSHLDIILRQDLLDLASVRDIQGIETLIELLRGRVGSTVSYASLAQDLQRDATTVKRWCTILEDLYIIFKVTPYHKNIARALLKEPKFYFYDYASIKDSGGKLENIVAHALLKELDYGEDANGVSGKLHFVRTKEGCEIDFLVVQDNMPTHLIEVKNKDSEPSQHFKRFKTYFGEIEQVQLVRHLQREKSYPSGVKVLSMLSFLSALNLEK